MIDSAIAFPNLKLSKLAFIALIIMAVTALSLSQFFVIANTSIWPFAIVWLLPNLARNGVNAMLALIMFIIGLAQDLILAQALGLMGAVNVAAYGFMLLANSYLPVPSKGSFSEAIFATMTYFLALFLVGILCQNIPSLFGLIIPFILTIISTGFLSKYFEVVDTNS
jgi:hypothetical protein